MLTRVVARRKAIFDDRPVEIAELTYVIKQDLAGLNSQISVLQQLTQSQHPTASQPRSADQEGQHNKNVVLMLQNKVTDVAANFKDVLEVRTKNIQASRSRTENFVSSVSARSQSQFDTSRSESPLYQNTSNRQRTPQASTNDLLTLEPSSTSTLMRNGPQSDQQLLLMEEANPTNAYIQERGQAIEAIERTINELGGIFGQLATMVSEQGEMLQRIDANTEDVVDNVQGAQRELLKYWNRVQGNRWLVAKMFGVLMVSRPVRFVCLQLTAADILSPLGVDLWLDLQEHGNEMSLVSRSVNSPHVKTGGEKFRSGLVVRSCFIFTFIAWLSSGQCSEFYSRSDITPVALHPSTLLSDVAPPALLSSFQHMERAIS